MTTNSPSLILHGVFTDLREHGMPLGVRDYLDALTALQAGFGRGDRDALSRLCRLLWARSESEERIIEELFARLPRLSPRATQGALGGPAKEPSATDSQGERETPPLAQEAVRRPLPSDQDIGVEFLDAEAPGGLTIPKALVDLVPTETFMLHEEPPIPLRELVNAWRRFRRTLRSGPPTELDVSATIHRQGRAGLLDAPVLVPARRNQARLVVLVDVSESMIAWRSFLPMLRQSFALANLGEIAMFFFANTPESSIFEDECMLRPVPLAAVLSRHSESSLLVVSDAGAARGYRNQERQRETEHFLRRVRHHWWPVAWLNPMPAARWRGSTAQFIAQFRSLRMFELSEAGIIATVDNLRGYAGDGFR